MSRPSAGRPLGARLSATDCCAGGWNRCVRAFRADSGLVHQPPWLLGPAGIMDHVADCLELGIDPEQKPRNRADGDNRQEKQKSQLAIL